MRSRCGPAVLLLSAAVFVPILAYAHDPSDRSSTLIVLEGTVLLRDEVKAEGGLSVVRVHLRTAEGTRRILLAPSSVLEQAELPVEDGDRIRVRAFSAEPDEDAAAHKVFNITRERMLRLRTLQRDPIWDSAGVWQGDHGRHRGKVGGHGGRGKERHGGGGRGGG